MSDERGAGIFSAVFGLSFFLVFLLLAVQFMWSLYATSVVTAAAYDAGRMAARTGSPDAGVARFEQAIGSYDASASISVPDAEGSVVVTVTGENPSLLPERLARTLPFATIERTVEIRNEVYVSDG